MNLSSNPPAGKDPQSKLSAAVQRLSSVLMDIEMSNVKLYGVIDRADGARATEEKAKDESPAPNGTLWKLNDLISRLEGVSSRLKENVISIEDLF